MNQNIANWIRLIFLALIWGSSFLLMKRGMIDKATGDAIFNNNQVATLRMLIAAAIIAPFAFKHLGKLFSKRNMLPLIIVGCLGNFIPAYLFTYAETSITSGMAGMLNSGTPIFTVIVGLIVFKQPLIKVQVVGILIGTLGIFTLVGYGSIFSEGAKISAILAVILATLCYASSLNTIKHTLGHITPFVITALGFLTTLPFSIFLFFQNDIGHTIITNEHSFNGLIYIGILGIIGTAISVVIFNRLIADSSAIFASSVTYFIPVVAAILGLLDGERLGSLQFIGMVIILIGVYIINIIGRKRKLMILEKSTKKVS
jgi:drug/metabolite transporter (DMT)-like permease